MEIPPAAPAALTPVATVTLPDLPDAVVPLLNNKEPLTPEVNALAVRMDTEPDVDTFPAPLTTLIPPPVTAAPATSEI